MALSATDFMAAPGGFVSAQATKLDKIDCSQVLAAVLKADKQLLGHIKMGPIGHNIETHWIEDQLQGNRIQGTYGTGSVTITAVSGFTGTVSLAAVVRENAILQAEGHEWYFKVTSATSAGDILGAIYCSGTDASVTAGYFNVVASPYADNVAASSDISMARDKRRNFQQVFERAVEIEQTRKNMDMEAVANELQHQIKYRTLEIKRELDMSVINGIAYWDGSNKTADLELRTMQGIIMYIRDPEMDNTPSDTLVTQISGALTVANLNTLCYDIWDAGGLDETSDPIILVGASQQRAIAGMEDQLRRHEQGERQVGFYKDYFITDMGVEMPVVLDRWMPSDKLVILDRSRVALRPMAGDQWHMEKMSKTGRSEKWQISGQYTIEVRNADKCHGLLYDLT
jgi:hypothetical protein